MNNITVGLFFIRLLLGVIFLMQGYGKVFTYGVEKVYQLFFSSYTEFLPDFLVKATVYFTSYAELLGGLLLILGLFRNYVYYLFIVVLLVVSLGHGIAQPIWDLQHVFFRSVLLIVLLFMPQEKDKWAIDHFIKNTK
ncbi:MAG: DoxX family membrane protein [Crocinitomicaceae bacterium]